MIGPEQGATLPGMTVVCGDSQTSTHGAFAALTFGVGTSDVEHVLATQCLLVNRMQPMLVQVNGLLPSGLTAKDLILAIIQKCGAAGGAGCAMEFAGPAIRALSMEGRMTLCKPCEDGTRGCYKSQIDSRSWALARRAPCRAIIGPTKSVGIVTSRAICGSIPSR